MLSILLFALFIAPKAFAHELFIQVQEDQQSSELQIDVLWGHLRDFLDQANYENYELYVQYPSGNVEELELEKIGVQARAYIQASEEGQYLFWASRKPSTYTPGDGVTRLSIQLAKTVYQVGEGNNNASEPVNLLLEIVPTTDLTSFTKGTIEGIVLFEGEPRSDITVTAYGPMGEHLEGVTGADGAFNFNFESYGEWLLKASFQTDESGILVDTEYELTGRTTTLLLDTTQPMDQGTSSPNNLTIIVVFIIGLLVGSGLTFVAIRKN